MKKHKYRNCNNSKIGDSCKRKCNCSPTSNSELNFEKNSGNITDNEYEVTSELNRKYKNKRSK